MSGNRPLFGKRNLGSAAPTQAKRIPLPTDADGVARVFPKELWDNPEMGDTLRKAGQHAGYARQRARNA